jgi:uroporphyrin-III C-methyltransferase / precorrin-2 dehydrogenase / sirohydrochlorin ferrochelatase
MPEAVNRAIQTVTAILPGLARLLLRQIKPLSPMVGRLVSPVALTRARQNGSRPGIVHLVGAGPGAADLLTLRALRLLGEADVVVHDRLVSSAVLDMARSGAERIFVGKARADHCMPQAEINDLLVSLAREGRRVVRLKGGDPFVFGRGGEEAEALEAAGLPFEVVPGITAALACAADARIPLTHRDCSRVLVLVTGHTRDGSLDLDFETLARPGQTIAVYMGITTLPRLRDGLVAAGLDPLTPVALIESGGTKIQRVLACTLDEVARAAAEWVRGGPVLLLIGEVVSHRTGLPTGDTGARCRHTRSGLAPA